MQQSEQLAARMEAALERYGTMLFRLCLLTLGNANDAEDAVQDTFLKYIQKAPVFADEEHEKAWLITVASNRCKDMLRFRKRHPLAETNEEGNEPAAWLPEESDGEILEALMALPEKFKTVLMLYYVEEYSIKEMAEIIGKTKSAVKMRLQKGRRLLEEAYGKSLKEE